MSTSEAPPPYVGFGVFQSTIETLAQSTVPSGPLDRRVLDWLSGADYGALISAMRFLGLVDPERRATKAYRDLVAAWKKGPMEYQSTLTETLSDRYDDIVKNVDMEFGTAAELEKAFKDAGVPSGQMLTKTIRFYVKLVSAMGVTVSTHITKPKRMSAAPRKNGTKLRSREKADKPTTRNEPAINGAAPAGFERLIIPGLAGAYIQYPADLTQAQFALFEAMVGVLRTYVEGRTTRREKTP